MQMAVTTDSQGNVFIPGFIVHDNKDELGDTKQYVQMVIKDKTQPEGYAITNAVSVRYMMYNLKAIQNRFKLITNLYGNEKPL